MHDGAKRYPILCLNFDSLNRVAPPAPNPRAAFRVSKRGILRNISNSIYRNRPCDHDAHHQYYSRSADHMHSKLWVVATVASGCMPFVLCDWPDVTGDLHPPCRSSCCHAANRCVVYTRLQLFGPRPWQRYELCLISGSFQCPSIHPELSLATKGSPHSIWFFTLDQHPRRLLHPMHCAIVHLDIAPAIVLGDLCVRSTTRNASHSPNS